MPNRLLERLGQDYKNLFDEYDQILNRCHAENRDPTSSEEGELTGLRSIMEPLGDRIVQLREDDDRRTAAVRAMTPAGGDVAASSAHPVPGRRHTPPPLRVGEMQLRAITSAITNRTPYHEAIEPMQTRAAVMTPVGATSPVWWPVQEYGVEERLAERITTRPAPESGNEFDYMATTTSATIGDVAEGAAKPDSGLVVSRRHVTVDKGAAYSDLSWEMQADFEGVEALVNTELAAGLVRWENAKIVAAILADAGILKPTPASTSNVVKALEAKQAVRAAPNVGVPDLVILNPLDWATLAGELAATSGVLIGGEEAVTVGPTETLWGMAVAQSVAVTAKTVVLGVAAAAAWFMRDGPRTVVDPYSQSTNNLTRVIMEERGTAGLLVPGRWATFTLP
jgi:HK97 family phage major capsid protein